MKKEEVFKKLDSTSNLPTLPVIMKKLTEAVRNPNSSAAQIAGIIKDDPAMMARILKVVNSSMYGFAEPVQSLQQALAIRGMNAINNVALTTAVFSTFSGKEAADFSHEAFWRHCINVGIASNVLYERTRETVKVKLSKDSLHLAGLLHDIGKVLLVQFFHAEFMEAVRRSKERSIPLWQAESEIFGANHAEVGAWLGKKWNLSPEVIQAIRWHHDPENGDIENIALLRLCHVANHICNLEKIGDSGDASPSFVMGVWKRIGLGVKDIEGIIGQVDQEAKKSETLMAMMTSKK